MAKFTYKVYSVMLGGRSHPGVNALSSLNITHVLSILDDVTPCRISQAQGRSNNTDESLALFQFQSRRGGWSLPRLPSHHDIFIRVTGFAPQHY